ncbi:MAG TPA: ATP-binding protein [Edaphocola sp.]|nr:ATP-binding protein [Edaphocola sp.]
MNNKLNTTIKVPFKVSARTAKLIGLENFSTEEGAVIELVKNTYDADANNCILIFDLKIKIEKTVDKEGNEIQIEKFEKENSSIFIIDNGIGMNDKIIQNQWMTIGTDNKLYEHTTELGRVKTGAKGIGRFALNRLGMLTDMTSLPTLISIEEEEEVDVNKFIPNNDNIGFEWTVDWKDFDKKGATVSDVEAVLSDEENLNLKKVLLSRFSSYPKVKEVLENIDFKSGTIIEITELNDEWNEDKLRKLFGNLEMLLPPEGQNDFAIDFFLLNNLEEFGTVKRAFYDDYDYKLKASYNQNNDKILNVEISRNELDIDALENRYSEVFEFDMMKNPPFKLEDFKKNKIDLNLPIEKLLSEKVDKDLLERVGQFGFTFYFLKNTISDDKEEGDVKKYPYKNFDSANRKSWLKKFGGIKMFRDDFRIRPYGENGDDWLRLGERQSKSPGGVGRLGGYRIRPNQIAGTIKISRLHNESFQDKSGREGIIENDVFDLFKNILLEIIGLFEKDRNIIMYNLSQLHSQRNEEAEKLRLAEEEAERVQRQKEERESQKDNTDKKNADQSSEENKDYSDAEEKMADGFLILKKENEKKDEELRLLRSLASVGLIISSFAHEVRSLRARLIPRTKFLVDELRNHLSEEKLSQTLDKDDNPFYMIDLMREEDIKLKHWLDYSLSTLKIDKRERKNLDFSKYFESFKANWSKALEQRNISLDLKKLDDDNEHIIRAFEVNMDSIFNNLLSNSINAHYGYNNEQKKIEIAWKNNGNTIEIYFSDNGKGLDEKYKDNPEVIFNLNESSKTDNKGNKIGTGLGLYIVKSIIEEYNNSSISIINIQDGLTFKIIFKSR